MIKNVMFSHAIMMFQILTKVLSKKSLLQITSGYYHTCVIANNLNSYCWGRNELILIYFF
jgi:alpha-tubulin suppressor-like RCC1 family protein